MNKSKLYLPLRWMLLLLISVAGWSHVAQAQSQGVTVSGTVFDDKYNESVIGAIVRVEGTTIGTSTDLDGNFTLKNVPLNSKVQITYVGYKPYNFDVTGEIKDLRVVLTEDLQELQELVVIGYGTSRKEDLSTSISTMKVDDAIKSGPSNLGSVLQGRLPGVTISNNGGDPLSGSSINIRGKGSRGGDQVLFVVDGVPGAPFNMEDVENITVLKDAASAAIYGASVGSGGVVVVTTKQANSGKVAVNFNVSYGFKNATNLPKVTTAAQYGQVWQKVAENGGSLPVVADPNSYPYGAVDRTDWLDEIFRTGSLQHYAVNLSGGSDKVRALASFSYDRDEGTLINTYAETFGGRANLDMDIATWLNFNQNVTAQYSNGQGGVNTTSHEGVIMNAVFYPTSATIYEQDENGNILLNDDGSQMFGGIIPRRLLQAGISGFGEIRNPVATLLRLRQNRPSLNFFSTSAITIMPIEHLSIKSAFSYGQEWSRNEGFSVKVLEPGRPNPVNSRSISNSLFRRWLWETTATYDRNFSDKHRLNLMGGYTMERSNYRWNFSGIEDFVSEDPHLTIMGAGRGTIQKPDEGISDLSMISGFVRGSYSYDDRYFITASVRNDLSSKLHKDHRSAVFPAVSGSWKISSEDFFEPAKSVVNLLKLRGSWGQVGNVSMVNAYAYNVPMSSARASVFGPQGTSIVYGQFQKSISNDDLKWETTESWGVGLDLSLFNKLSVSLDYYNKFTKDLIEKMPIVSTMGVDEEPYGNVGSVINKGWELSIDYKDRVGAVDFNIYGNLTTLHNEVLSLGARDFIQDDYNINSLQPIRSAVGQPWQSYYLIQTDGVFKSQAEVEAYTYTNPETGNVQLIQPNAAPGDLKFVDHNNDGMITDDDKQYLGSYLPKLTYSLGGSLSYAGIDLSLMLQGVSGNKIFNGFKLMGLTGRAQGNNMLATVMDSYEFNPNSGMPRLGVETDPNGNYTSLNDYFLEDGSYLRLKNVTLGYTLPKSLMKHIGLENNTIRAYVSGENLFTITKYSGMDPEVGGVGIDGGRYPVSRTFTVGINLSL